MALKQVIFKQRSKNLKNKTFHPTSTMADVDPSTFLRSEKSQGGETVLYDAKKWLWVPDENAGFIAGQIKEQTGDTVTIELNNGQVTACCKKKKIPL